MDTITLSLQLLLLIIMFFVWWVARKDLLSIAETQQTPTLDKIEKLRAAVDEMLNRLDQKLTQVENHLESNYSQSIEPPKKHPNPKPVKLTVKATPAVDQAPTVSLDVVMSRSESDTRYSEVYALADSGVSPDEIARRTGLGSAEVEMVINLRPLSGDE